MEHQYPGLISPDEHMLAELMLPDQTHVRSQDWTMFFLHKDQDGNEAEQSPTKGKTKPPKDDGDEEEDEDGEESDEEESEVEESQDEDEDDAVAEPPLMYVLNLVNTKQDNTVKR